MWLVLNPSIVNAGNYGMKRMAKNRNDKNQAADSQEIDVTEDTAQGSVQQYKQAPLRPAVRKNGVNIFKMYKPNQGKRIRMGTGIGVGILLVGAWDWTYRQLYTASFIDDRVWLATAIALGLCAVIALATWYLVGVRPGTVDFLVATEGEMKKVTWSSRKDVWGATKVVIGMVFLVTLGLFIVDLSFTWFFSWIGVLKSPFGS